MYSDLFNGNMVLEHSDTVMTGNRNPVSVNHYYNSCLATANSYNCGYGWKTNAHQKISARTHNSRNYYVWEDGDGTEHFFEATGSQPYKDAEGMDLELTVNSSNTQIMITDKQDNAMLFQIVQSGLAWRHGNEGHLDDLPELLQHQDGEDRRGRSDLPSAGGP